RPARNYFLAPEREAFARVLAALPACLAAVPAARAADLAPPTTPPAARLAWLAAVPAVRPWRVAAAFLPAVSDCAFCWLRLRVAAAFFAAAERSAFVCGIESPVVAVVPADG